MKRKIKVLFLTVVIALNLIACSSAPTTAEEYYTRPVVKAALDAQIEKEGETLKAQMQGICSDFGYEVKGNTFTYWYKLTDQIGDSAVAKEQLEGSITEAQLSEMVTSIEEECGIEGITLQYIYYKSDGSVLCEISHKND